MAQQYPGKISLTLGYDESFAHKIEASVDLFLMPSIFEPCGLNQMYSLRYGSLPVVNAVGGLRDTVIEMPLDAIGTEGNGFVFHSPKAEDLHLAIKRALLCYQLPDAWKKLQQNAMSQDFSWDKSAMRYEEIYRQGIAALRNQGS
jgi:starch synthase